jgi:hypothetical protein
VSLDRRRLPWGDAPAPRAPQDRRRRRSHGRRRPRHHA